MSLPETLVSQVGAVAIGASLLLGAGALLVLRAQEPLHRQRLGELALLVALLWVPLALVPLPRLGSASWLGGETPVPAPAADAVSAAGVAGAHASEPGVGSLDRAPGRQQPSVGAPGVATEEAGPTSASGSEELDRPAGSGPGRRVAGTRAGLDAVAHTDPGEVAPGADAGRRAAPAARPGDDAQRGASAPAHADLARTFTVLWLVGSLLAAGWLLVGLARLVRILAAARPAPEWVAELARPGPLADTSQRARVLQATRGSPFCVGLGRPVIVLPSALLHGDRSVLRHVLLHELAHARHGDGRGRLLTALALVVFWWHPLCWWLRRRVHLASEHVADAQAADVAGRRAYIADLVQLAEDALLPRGAPVGLPTVLDGPSDFYRRMTMLLTHEGRLQTRCSGRRRLAQTTGALALLAVMTGAIGATPARAQDSDALLNQLRNENEVLRVELRNLQEELEAIRLSARAPERDDAFPAEAFGVPGERPPGASRDASFPGADRAGPRADAGAGDPSSLTSDDVLELAMRAVDLGEELEIARTALSGDQRRLVEEGYVSRQEWDVAELRVQSLQRKLSAVRILIDAETRVIQLELEKQMRTPRVDEAQVTRLRARLDVLRSVIDGESADEPHADAPHGGGVR